MTFGVTAAGLGTAIATGVAGSVASQAIGGMMSPDSSGMSSAGQLANGLYTTANAPNMPAAPPFSGGSTADSQALGWLNTLGGTVNSQVNNPWSSQYVEDAQTAGLQAIGLGAQNSWLTQDLAGLSHGVTGTVQGMLPNVGDRTGLDQAMAGARTAADYGGQTAGNLFGLSNTATQGANQIYQNAFDPQNALYNRTLQQVQDQTRAGQAARGIELSGYGANLEGQNISNFNIDWQNQQLGREVTGLQGFTTAGNAAQQYGTGATNLAASSAALPMNTNTGYWQSQAGLLNSLGAAGGQAGQIGTMAGNIGTQGYQATLASGAMPYNASMDTAQRGQSAISSALSSDLSYLGYGSNNYANQMQGYGNQVQGVAGAGNMIGQGVSALGQGANWLYNNWGGLTGGGGGGGGGGGDYGSISSLASGAISG